MRDGLNRFKWERLLISERGPSATTRLVGLVLATHMNKELTAWPSIALLSKKTGLTDRAVGIHLQNLEDEGWIARSLRGGGKGWRNYQYRLICPKAPEVTTIRAEPASAAHNARRGEPPSVAGVLEGRRAPHAADRPSVGGDSDAPGTDLGSNMLPNQVPGNTEMIISNTTSWNISGAAEKASAEQPNIQPVNSNAESVGMVQRTPSSVPEWAERLGLSPYQGEHPGAFQARVAEAREAWLQGNPVDGKAA